MTSVEEPEPEPEKEKNLSPTPATEQPALTPTGSSIHLTPITPPEEKPDQPKKSGPRSPWDTRHEFAHVDKIFIFVFPICFLSFNLLYWTICIQFQDSLKA